MVKTELPAPDKSTPKINKPNKPTKTLAQYYKLYYDFYFNKLKPNEQLYLKQYTNDSRDSFVNEFIKRVIRGAEGSFDEQEEKMLTNK